MKSSLTVMALAIGLAPGAFASPLITSSEVTLASICMGYEDTSERIVEVCKQALAEADPKTTRVQTAMMMDALGTAYLNLGQINQAEAIFHQMIEANPGATTGLNGLGWVEWNRGNHARAEETFQRSVNISAGYENLAGLASNQFETKSVPFDQAMQLLDASLSIKPDYRWAIREKGWRYYNAAKLDEAEAAFRQALKISRADSNALRGLLNVLERQNRFADSLPLIEQAMQITPVDPWFLSQRSLAHYYLGNYNQALRDADRLLQEYPPEQDHYVRKSRALAALGKMGAALTLLQEGQAEFENPAFMRYWHASLLSDDGQFAAALRQIRLVTEHPSGRASGSDFEMLAYIHLQLDNISEARNAVDLGLRRSQDLDYLNYYDIEIRVREGQYGPALDRFDTLMQTGMPKVFVGYLAQVLIERRQYTMAIALRAKYPDLTD